MWENLPSWLRGGIIGLILGIILAIIFYSGNLFYNCENLSKATNAGVCLGNPISSLILYIFTYLSIVSYPLFQVFISPSYSIYAEAIIFVGILWFFIYGAIIGWIVGKIKRYKN